MVILQLSYLKVNQWRINDFGGGQKIVRRFFIVSLYFIDIGEIMSKTVLLRSLT